MSQNEGRGTTLVIPRYNYLHNLEQRMITLNRTILEAYEKLMPTQDVIADYVCQSYKEKVYRLTIKENGETIRLTTRDPHDVQTRGEVLQVECQERETRTRIKIYLETVEETEWKKVIL